MTQSITRWVDRILGVSLFVLCLYAAMVVLWSGACLYWHDGVPVLWLDGIPKFQCTGRIL